MKNKKAAISSKDNGNQCFQYTITVALNHKNIVTDLQRISKIKPFTDKYGWKEIKFLSHKNDCKKFESNNKTIALNVLYIPNKSEEIRHAYISKHNSTLENQLFLLMITDNEKWHYLAVKKDLHHFVKQNQSMMRLSIL